ncbi:MAG: globin-coupled sensor protein [Rhizobiales bacterium]|nr:globin-coupled sensor protein [Hyphomicrobiales bacterium]
MDPSNSLSTRLSFSEITDDTRLALAELRPFVVAQMPAALDEFYGFLSRFPEVQRHFTDRAIQSHAKAAQLRHWEQILAGTFDEAYVESAHRIGRVHHRLGLEPQWYIGGYRKLLVSLLRRLETRPRGRWLGKADHDKQAALIDALVTVVLLDMDFVISVYLDAGKQEKSDALQNLSERFEQTIGQITQGVAGMAETLKGAADGLTTIAKDTQLLSTTVATSSREATDSVKSAATGTESLESSIGEISQKVHDSLETATSAVTQAEMASSRIGELNQAASQIGDVIKIIGAIAQQTNLLALNATIEAARAGESGKGFAVVAHEVKQLASQTSKATDEITAQIAEIQTVTGTTVAAISQISETIASISQNSKMIAEAVERQMLATKEITYNITMAATGSTEVAAAIVNVSKGSENTEAAAANVHGSANALQSESRQLQSEVDKFLVALRTA